MTGITKKINQGVYLVIDPSLDESILIQKLQLVLQDGIVAVQIWDNFPAQQNTQELIERIIRLCHEKDVPVLINNRWEWLKITELDGIHFDQIPENLDQIREEINRNFISGLTCNNDLSVLYWANDKLIDYISFCSIFPSRTSNSCELVKFETIREARTLTTMPIFLAGGIKPENMPKLAGLNYDGIAVISGIMSSDDPGESIRKYLRRLKRNKA